MPRGGAVTLSDVREPALVIVCEPCERRGRYKAERLMAEHGDAKLTDLLTILAGLPEDALVSVHDRCKAAYGQRLPYEKASVTRSVASRIRNGGVADVVSYSAFVFGNCGMVCNELFLQSRSSIS